MEYDGGRSVYYCGLILVLVVFLGFCAKQVAFVIVCLAVIRDWCLGLFLFMFWGVYTCYATGSDGFRC